MLISKKEKIFSKVKSSSLRTSNVRDKELNKFYINTTKKHGDKYSLDNDTHIKNNVGNIITCCSACVAGEITGLQKVGEGNTFELVWDLMEGVSYYTVQVIKGNNTIGMPTITVSGASSATIVYDPPLSWNNVDDDTFIVTAHKSVCTVSTSIKPPLPCFLAGSLVRMIDGTSKAIEDVKVNDIVVGAFGEFNRVLFLHRPLLGTASMCVINDEHHTTTHHPHISVDKKFYCGDPDAVSTLTYGRSHSVLNEQGEVVEQMLHGLNKERILPLQLGVELQYLYSSRKVNTMEVYSLPEDTQLYNLVVSGSHTYYVDGYAVTGWPREDDFDYDTWIPKPI
jgi:hypothetical protein